jgi:hypothetical protein
MAGSSAVEARVRKAGANTCQEREEQRTGRMFGVQRLASGASRSGRVVGKLESWRWIAGCWLRWRVLAKNRRRRCVGRVGRGCRSDYPRAKANAEYWTVVPLLTKGKAS